MTKDLKEAVRTEEVFNLIKKTIRYTIHEHGFHFTKYSFILREEDNALRVINGENAILDRVESLKKSDFPPRLMKTSVRLVMPSKAQVILSQQKR